MTTSAQNLIVLAVIVAAGVYVAWRTWRIVTKRAGGGCGRCDANRAADDPAAPTIKPFVSIDSLSENRASEVDD